MVSLLLISILIAALHCQSDDPDPCHIPCKTEELLYSHDWDNLEHHLVTDYSFHLDTPTNSDDNHFKRHLSREYIETASSNMVSFTNHVTNNDHDHASKCISSTDNISLTKAANKELMAYPLNYEEYINVQFDYGDARDDTETRRHALYHSARMDVDDECEYNGAYMNLFDRKVCTYPFLALIKASHANHLSNPSKQPKIMQQQAEKHLSLKRFDDDEMNRLHKQYRPPRAMNEDDIEIEMSDMYNSLIVIFLFLFATDYHTISLILLLSLSSPTNATRNLLADVTYSGSWSTVTSTSLRLPRADRQMAIGSWNGSIFILGGSGYGRALVELDIADNQMIDHGTTYLANDTFSSAQFWTQREEILYIISNDGYTLNAFNVRNKEFTQNYNNINIPIAPLIASGLASYDDRLFVVGGKNQSNGAVNTLQIYNITRDEWSYGASLNTAKMNPGCVVHEATGTLFAIGGYNGITQITSNERISVDGNGAMEEWHYIDPLKYKMAAVRAVVFGHDILALSGYSTNAPNYLPYVQVIDTMTGTVTNGVHLGFGAYCPAVIRVGGIVYAFGGSTGSTTRNWQYYALPLTIDPTDYPTLEPTVATINPTKGPSNVPTVNPSENPTYDPCEYLTDFDQQTPLLITEDQTLATMQILPYQSIEFDVDIHSICSHGIDNGGGANDCNILWIGTNAAKTDRVFGLWTRRRIATGQLSWEPRFASNENWNHATSIMDPAPTVGKHHFAMIISPNQVFISIDSVMSYNSSSNYNRSEYFGITYNITFSSPDWNEWRSADATVSNITLNSWISNMDGCDTAEPTTEPTTEPTLEPTLNPTNNPTDDPTINPTVNPTINPTINPTVNPTINPTVNPMVNPTVTPTVNPTVTPTVIPTVNPTVNPSDDPTDDPTIAPSGDPTAVTVDVTIDSTHEHAVDVTIYFNISITSANITVTEVLTTVDESVGEYIRALNADASYDLEYDIVERKEENGTPTTVIETKIDVYNLPEGEVDETDLEEHIQNDLDEEYGDDVKVKPIIVRYWNIVKDAFTKQSYYDQIAIGFGVAVLLLFLLNILDQKCFRPTDIFQMTILIKALLQFMDTISDYLFCATLKFHDSEAKLVYYLFIASCVCTVGPSLTSMYQLYLEMTNKWLLGNNIELRHWLLENQTFLYMISFLTGSSFSAINLAYSGLFQIDKLSIPLTKLEYVIFVNKRIYSVIFFENVPQIIFQCIFIKVIQERDLFDPMTFISLSFSLISIISSVGGLFGQKKMLQFMKRQEYVKVKVDIKGETIEKNREIYARKIRTIQRHFAVAIRTHFIVTDMRKPEPITDGLAMEMIVFVDDGEVKKDEIRGLWGTYVNSEDIKEHVSEAWSLKKEEIEVTNGKTDAMDSLKQQIETNIALSAATKGEAGDRTGQSIVELEERNNGKCSEWNGTQILQWILSIENGRYEQYKDTLADAFKEDAIDGAILSRLDKSDWRSFGVSDYKDRDDLHEYVQTLLNPVVERVNSNDDEQNGEGEEDRSESKDK